jgi:hypothetical protein
MNAEDTAIVGHTDEVIMRRRSGKLAHEYAVDIREYMPLARQAYGQQKQGSPAREASDIVNGLLLEYDSQGGNMTQLAEELDGVITLAGIRRRLRVARAGTRLGQVTERKFRGDRDPEKIAEAVKLIGDARGTPLYGVEIRHAYDKGLSLSAIAEELGVSYYTAWSSMSTTQVPMDEREPVPEAV